MTIRSPQRAFHLAEQYAADKQPALGYGQEDFDAICIKAGIQANEIKPKAAFLCQVVTLVTNNKEVGLLLPISGTKKMLGEPEQAITFKDEWPDMQELRWNGGGLSIFTERGNIMRITSYQVGDYLELKPFDTTSQMTIPIKVGMTKADLFAVLSEGASVKKNLAKGGKVEEWSYFPDLGMGVLIEDDVVKGITVTPVQYEAAQG